MDWNKLIQSDNPIFAGGVGLGVLALGTQGLRASYRTLLILLKRHFLVTLEVTSKDRAYPWVLQWLSNYSRRNQHVSVETSFKAMDNTDPLKTSIFDFVPGPGQHFIWYNGMFINIQRFREQQMLDLNTGKPWEKIQFTAIGRDTKPFEKILLESFLLVSSKIEDKTIIYTNWGTDWRPFGQPRNRRPLESVILDEGLSERIVKDVMEWKNSSKWYHDRGIPYRRGYLLHGPPGSGKSSFIMALAGHLNYNICILNLAERGLTDDRLAQALSCVPPHSIVLLEDIDAAFPSRVRGGSNTPGSTTGVHLMSDVTFSGLLNVMDGVASR
jgi:chaperone BCS1